MTRKGGGYSRDENGLIVEDVGSWAIDKLKIVTDYVHASGAARRGYFNGAAYIDVFCGPGRSRKNPASGEFIDGSPVAAYEILNFLARFTSINISDADPELLATAAKRLSDVGAPVHTISGPASSAIPKIVQSLNPLGLHFAFLDPHNLGTLILTSLKA